MQNYLEGIAHVRMELTGLTGGADNTIKLPSDVTALVGELDYEVIIFEGGCAVKKASKTASQFVLTTLAGVTAVSVGVFPRHPPSVGHIE